MTNKQAMKYVSYMIDKSNDVVEKRALSRALIALANKSYDTYAQIDEGWAVTYFTNKQIECKARNGECTVYADGEPIFATVHANERQLGLKCEVAIFDNSVDNKTFNEVVCPCIRGESVIIHNDYDIKVSDEEYKRLKHAE